VPGGNVDELSGRIVELLSDETLARRLGDSGREFVRQNLDARISARSVMEIYNTLLDSSEREFVPAAGAGLDLAAGPTLAL
jgi:glycosyltransferase involved in cell wall biosynthesis